MKILFINLPYSGHIIPTLGLVKALTARGHQVTYLLTAGWRDKITEVGCDFVEYADSPKLSAQMKNACAAADKIASGFDMIIYEQFFFLGKHIADKHSKPAVRIFTPLAMNDILMKEFVNGGGFEIFHFKWARIAFTREVSQGFELKTDFWLDEILENPPELNLVYTVREFQPYQAEFPEENYKFLGTSIYKREEHSEFSLPESDRPLIYISLGTIANKAVSFYKKCIAAFKKESVTVVMSVGKSINVRNLGKIPDNFTVYSHVPQLEVLKKADVFVTHGGMNSITESLYFCVPMVVIPHMTDQPVNAKRVEELNLGRRLDKNKITPRLLRETVNSVINDETIRGNVQTMRENFHLFDANLRGAELIEQYYSKYSQCK